MSLKVFVQLLPIYLTQKDYGSMSCVIQVILTDIDKHKMKSPIIGRFFSFLYRVKHTAAVQIQKSNLLKLRLRDTFYSSDGENLKVRAAIKNVDSNVIFVSTHANTHRHAECRCIYVGICNKKK